ncbi:metallopeptidase TldD-related protein [Streptomyces sp. NBC_01358]|uniref:metallopeptidase TldD-related protein n=1 Tax=Streptomyces sp. NBC_01358 TaxID=2903837 RepID=UPI002E35A5CA|nr:metallopeptidase TldD-related protein [Streptomyces sp. NBC_01358]
MHQASDRYEVCRTAEDTAGRARTRERVDALVLTSTRRKHRILDAGVRSGAPLRNDTTLVRLAAGGRDVHTSVHGTAPDSLIGALEAARRLLPFGRLYAEARPLLPDTTWDQVAFLDNTAETPDSLAWLLTELQGLAQFVGSRQDVSLRIADCVLTVDHRATAFASPEIPQAAEYGVTRLELRTLVEVERAGRRIRLWAARHGHRLRELPMKEMLEEAGWRGAAMLASHAKPGPGAGNTLMLAPRAAASLLGLVVKDLVDGFPVSTGPLPATVLDDPTAAGGYHVHPFDEEGAPSGPTVLLGRTGTRTRLTCRGSGDGQGTVALTGHAARGGESEVPEALPSNVRLETAPSDYAHDEYEGLLAYDLRGDGVQRMRSGSCFTVRLDVARLREGKVAHGAGTVVLTATTAEVLSAITATTPTRSYFPGRTHSVGGAWLSLGLSSLRFEYVA